MERTSRKIFTISPAQAAVLLVNMHKGAQDPDVGFEDADNSLGYVSNRLQRTRKIRVQRQYLESALWSCNMMAEQGKFWGLFAKTQTFDQFVESLGLRADEYFDTETHLILKRNFK